MMMTFEKIAPPADDCIDAPVVQSKHPTRPIDPINVAVWAVILPLMTLLWLAAIVWLLFF